MMVIHIWSVKLIVLNVEEKTNKKSLILHPSGKRQHQRQKHISVKYIYLAMSTPVVPIPSTPLPSLFFPSPPPSRALVGQFSSLSGPGDWGLVCETYRYLTTSPGH